MSDLRLESAYAGATAAILDTLRQSADSIASAYHEDNAMALATLWARVAGCFDIATKGETDGRTAKWRCRFRIYSTMDPDEPAADSDSELPPDRPGETVIFGLPSVAAELVALAGAFHGRSVVKGLSRDELARRINALRPTLSRRRGNAVWRVPYTTIEIFNERTTERGWLMRVDIVRETETP